MYKSFTEMPLWKESFDLSVEIFNLTVGMPRSEDYGLTSRIRRSATSISANLSEGYGRRTNADKAYFYVIARGNAYETQNHLLYGNKVGYFEQDKMESLFNKYSNLIFSLNKLIKSISSQSQSKFQSQP